MKAQLKFLNEILVQLQLIIAIVFVFSNDIARVLHLSTMLLSLNSRPHFDHLKLVLPFITRTPRVVILRHHRMFKRGCKFKGSVCVLCNGKSPQGFSSDLSNMKMLPLSSLPILIVASTYVISSQPSGLKIPSRSP